VADSMRLRIADAAVARLALASVTVNGTARTKPLGLTAHRFPNRPITTDQLPAIVLFFLESPKPEYEASDTADRVLRLVCEFRAIVPAGTPPDDAVDPLINWAALALLSDEDLGGLAEKIDEGPTLWEAVEEGQRHARARTVYDITHITLRNDPEAQP